MYTETSNLSLAFIQSLPEEMVLAARTDLENAGHEIRPFSFGYASLIRYILSYYSEYLTEEQYQTGQTALTQLNQQDDEAFDQVCSDMDAYFG